MPNASQTPTRRPRGPWEPVCYYLETHGIRPENLYPGDWDSERYWSGYQWTAEEAGAFERGEATPPPGGAHGWREWPEGLDFDELDRRYMAVSRAYTEAHPGRNGIGIDAPAGENWCWPRSASILREREQAADADEENPF